MSANKQNMWRRPGYLTPIKTRLFGAEELSRSNRRVIHQSTSKKSDSIRSLMTSHKNRSLYEIYKDQQKRLKDKIASKVREQNSSIQVKTLHRSKQQFPPNDKQIQRVKSEIESLNQKMKLRLVSRKQRILKVKTEPSQMGLELQITKKQFFGAKRLEKKKFFEITKQSIKYDEGHDYSGSPWAGVSRHRSSMIIEDSK